MFSGIKPSKMSSENFPTLTDKVSHVTRNYFREASNKKPPHSEAVFYLLEFGNQLREAGLVAGSIILVNSVLLRGFVQRGERNA